MSTESFEALSMGEANDALMRQSGKGPSLQLPVQGDTPRISSKCWSTVQNYVRMYMYILYYVYMILYAYVYMYINMYIYINILIYNYIHNIVVSHHIDNLISTSVVSCI